MRKTLLFTILVIFVLSLFVACQPAEPEVQEVAEPEPQAEPEPVVEEEPAITATALYDGVPVLYATMLRGDAVTVTGEDGEYYIIDNNGIQMLIEKSMVKLSTEEAFEAEAKVLDESGFLYPNAYLKGDCIEIPAGTVVSVEDSFNGILFVKYTDETGNEISGYMSETDTVFAKNKSKSDSDSSSKKSSKKSKKSSGGSSDPAPAPAPDPAPTPAPAPAPEAETSGDGGEIELANDYTTDYGIVLLSVDSTELAVTETPQSDEGAEPPAGLAGDDQSDNPEGIVPEEESIYPVEGVVFSDGAEVYIGKLVKDAVYTVESADDLSVVIYFDDLNTGSAPRWSVAMEGDVPYESKQMYLIDDVIVYLNCFGRGDGITATKNALVTIIGETGEYYILQFEDGSIFYLIQEGGDAYFMTPEEFEAQQAEDQNDSGSDKKKSSKKKSSGGSSGGSSEPAPAPAPEPAPSPTPAPDPDIDPGADDSQFTPTQK